MNTPIESSQQWIPKRGIVGFLKNYSEMSLHRHLQNALQMYFIQNEIGLSPDSCNLENPRKHYFCELVWDFQQKSWHAQQIEIPRISPRDGDIIVIKLELMTSQPFKAEGVLLQRKLLALLLIMPQISQRRANKGSCTVDPGQFRSILKTPQGKRVCSELPGYLWILLFIVIVIIRLWPALNPVTASVSRQLQPDLWLALKKKKNSLHGPKNQS